ncbi:MAG: tetratricopeptide repeat protein, partial [Bacteroidota bacterium]
MLALILSGIGLSAQQDRIPELRARLDTAQSVPDQLDLMVTLSKIWHRADGDSARWWAEKAVKLGAELGETVEYANALGMLGMIKVEAGERAAGEEMVENALAMMEKVGEVSEAAAAAIDMGRVARRTGDSEKAFEYCIKARRYAEESQDSSLLSRCFHLIA